MDASAKQTTLMHKEQFHWWLHSKPKHSNQVVSKLKLCNLNVPGVSVDVCNDLVFVFMHVLRTCHNSDGPATNAWCTVVCLCTRLDLRSCMRSLNFEATPYVTQWIASWKAVKTHRFLFAYLRPTCLIFSWNGVKIWDALWQESAVDTCRLSHMDCEAKADGCCHFKCVRCTYECMFCSCFDTLILNIKAACLY